MSSPVSFSQNKFFFDHSQPQRTADRRPVTLYFIGYELIDEKGRLPEFPVKGRVIKAPPVGESIVVNSVIAKDLMTRSQMYDQRIGWQQAFTEDPSIAAAVKEAYDSGRLQKGSGLASFTELMAKAQVQTISDEDLEKELERRKTRTRKGKETAPEKEGGQ